MECVFSRRNGVYLPAPQAASRIVQSGGRKFKNSCINSWWVILLYKPHFSPYCGAQRVSYFSSQSRRISLSQVVRSIFHPFCFYSAHSRPVHYPSDLPGRFVRRLFFSRDNHFPIHT